MALNTFYYLIAGLAGLWLGTDLVIRGAIAISDRLKLSRVFVGLTILAVGTDLPELVVSITSSFDRLSGVDSGGIVIGNIIGSNFGQILLTLGLVGLFAYFTLTRRQVLREGSVLLGSILVFFFLGLDGNFSRIDGLIMIALYAAYFIAIPKQEEKVDQKVKKAPTINLPWSVVSLIAGLVIVISASETVVDSAVMLAQAWDVSQTVIGILIVGVGTSLPELIISFGAVLRGAPGLSIGNLIGSNIFDTLFVTGIGSLIASMAIERNILFFDLPYLFVASLIVLLFFLRKKGLQKKEAVFLLMLYAVYVTLKLFKF